MSRDFHADKVIVGICHRVHRSSSVTARRNRAIKSRPAKAMSLYRTAVARAAAVVVRAPVQDDDYCASCCDTSGQEKNKLVCGNRFLQRSVAVQGKVGQYGILKDSRSAWMLLRLRSLRNVKGGRTAALRSWWGFPKNNMIFHVALLSHVPSNRQLGNSGHDVVTYGTGWGNTAAIRRCYHSKKCTHTPQSCYSRRHLAVNTTLCHSP